MGTLQLKLDPTALEAGANRAKAALAGVKGEAAEAESDRHAGPGGVA